MKFMFKSSLKYFVFIITMLLVASSIYGQVPNRKPFPFKVVNNTPYPDDQVYVLLLEKILLLLQVNTFGLIAKQAR